MSKVDLASVKGYYGGVEKNSDDKLTEMDEIRVNVVNSDGGRFHHRRGHPQQYL